MAIMMILAQMGFDPLTTTRTGRSPPPELATVLRGDIRFCRGPRPATSAHRVESLAAGV